MQKNTAGKWVVMAFDETDNTRVTGDAANITANVRIETIAIDLADVDRAKLDGERSGYRLSARGLHASAQLRSNGH